MGFYLGLNEQFRVRGVTILHTGRVPVCDAQKVTVLAGYTALSLAVFQTIQPFCEDIDPHIVKVLVLNTHKGVLVVNGNEVLFTVITLDLMYSEGVDLTCIMRGAIINDVIMRGPADRLRTGQVQTIIRVTARTMGQGVPFITILILIGRARRVILLKEPGIALNASTLEFVTVIGLAVVDQTHVFAVVLDLKVKTALFTGLTGVGHVGVSTVIFLAILNGERLHTDLVVAQVVPVVAS